MITRLIIQIMGLLSLVGSFRVYSGARKWSKSLRLFSNKINAAQSDALELYERLSQCDDPLLSGKVKGSLGILADALRLYGPECLFSSYNGGKDAVVTMHLLRAAVAKYSTDLDIPKRPQFVYFAIDDEFDEVKDFLAKDEERFHLDLHRYDMAITHGLEAHMAHVRAEGGSEADSAFAFVLGTRQGDPNCGDQEKFTPSSSWMPPFMRVNPILDWTYGDVWQFIRRYQLPYCSLYEEGFTSLGKVTDTRPNPALRKADGSGYYPAYYLADWSQERNGRGVGSSTDAAAVAEISAAGKAASVQRIKGARTAALLVVGNEILSGLNSDENILCAATQMSRAGVDLQAVRVVRDDLEDIRAAVCELMEAYDCVVTSGGVGPTHDDVTLKAVASASGGKLVLNVEMLEHLQEAFGEDMDRSKLAMAQLPDKSILRYPKAQGSWPILQVENVFVLPGVPKIFAKKMETLVSDGILGEHTAPLLLVVMRIASRETELMEAVSELEELAAEHNVDVGIYEMRMDDEGDAAASSATTTSVTLRGRDKAVLKELQDVLLQRISRDKLLSCGNSLEDGH